MIVIDTNVLADHFRRPDASVAQLLLDRQLVIHPFVVNELAMGNLSSWRSTVDLLWRFAEQVPVASPHSLHDFIEGQGLVGSGLSFVDAHLLMFTTEGPHRLWTRDRKLLSFANQLGYAFDLKA